jgi:hypothetical protein
MNEFKAESPVPCIFDSRPCAQYRVKVLVVDGMNWTLVIGERKKLASVLVDLYVHFSLCFR